MNSMSVQLLSVPSIGSWPWVVVIPELLLQLLCLVKGGSGIVMFMRKEGYKL